MRILCQMNKWVLGVLVLISTVGQGAGDLRSFDLDPSFGYVRGRFDMEREESALLTHPTRPTRERSQAVRVYDETPRSFEECVLIPEEDGRVRIMETEKFPWCVHGQMTMEFGGSRYGGSGVLVGPHHFLTAAHNVYKHATSEQATGIKIHLGLNDTAALFGEVLGTKVYLYNAWMRGGDKGFDMALVILNKSIGFETGWAGLLCLEEKELKEHKVHVSGYPGDKGLKTLWTMEDTISRVGGDTLHYLIDTHKGQSGGAIWIKNWGMPHVLGTHAYEGSMMEGGNYGVRLSERKIKDIVGWIRETFLIEARVPPAPAVTGGGGGGRGEEPSGYGYRARARSLPTVPPVAVGHEEAYRQFLRGVLVYKTNKENDIGRINLPIRDLANPLEGTFDLSRCGEAGEYLSIHTGYKKAKISANKSKLEIWLMPRFLVEANLEGDARWLRDVMPEFEAPYGIVWTWGGWDVGNDNFEYLLKGDILIDKSKNCYVKWLASKGTPPYLDAEVCPSGRVDHMHQYRVYRVGNHIARKFFLYF